MHHILCVSIQKKNLLFLICSQCLAYLLTQASSGLYCLDAFSTRLHLGSSRPWGEFISQYVRRGSILLYGLLSWQVWALTSACVCTHMWGKMPGNSHSCVAVTAGALQKTHLQWISGPLFLARWHGHEVTAFQTSSVCGQHHLIIDGGPNELEWRRCLVCPCLQPSCSKSAVAHCDSVSTQSQFLHQHGRDII